MPAPLCLRPTPASHPPGTDGLHRLVRGMVVGGVPALLLVAGGFFLFSPPRPRAEPAPQPSESAPTSLVEPTTTTASLEEFEPSSEEPATTVVEAPRQTDAFVLTSSRQFLPFRLRDDVPSPTEAAQAAAPPRRNGPRVFK